MSTTEEIIKYYTEKQCSTCKGICNRGIVVIQDRNVTCAKCMDYEKDEDKIEKYKRPLNKTAKLQPTVMGLAGPDWS